MKNIRLYSFFCIILLYAFPAFLLPHSALAKTSLWNYSSIDTMKLSRDAARNGFKADYLTQLQQIKDLGASYVAIDTPYDEEFYPYLKKWADTAHALELHVWFRGNFSGWEGWFDYPKTLTRLQHLQQTKQFIENHKDVFVDGDSFTACPECEYGGPGNPLITRDFDGYRRFMLDEYEEESQGFASIHKQVYINWLSMNPDVAKEILDKKTLQAIGNVVTLDYYVKDTEQLQKGIGFFLNKFPDARIFMGEFGAPIPDINGIMDEDQQANFIDQIMRSLYLNKRVIGFNYWVNTHGSTAIFNSDDTAKKATSTIKKYFTPLTIQGVVTDELQRPVGQINISLDNGEANTITNADGKYSIAVPFENHMLVINNAKYYVIKKLVIARRTKSQDYTNIILKPIHPNVIYKIELFLKKTFSDIKNKVSTLSNK